MIFKTHVFSLFSHLCNYIATQLHTVYLDWLQAVLESNSRSTWQGCWSELRDRLCGCDRASWEMHLEAVIEQIWRYTSRLWSSDWEMHPKIVMEWVWRCTGRQWSSEFWDALRGNHLANLVAVIKQVSRYTWRPWSSMFCDKLWGWDPACFDEYLEEVVGSRPGCWDSNHQLVISQLWECDEVPLPLSSDG